MKRKTFQEESKAGAPEWMVTYGDMVTLLLCFFVLLFALSTIDVEKFKEVRELGLKRRETVWSLSAVGAGNLKGLLLVREDRSGRTSGVPVNIVTGKQIGRAHV